MVTNDSTPTLSLDTDTEHGIQPHVTASRKRPAKKGDAGKRKEFEREAGKILQRIVERAQGTPGDLSDQAKRAEQKDRYDHPAKYITDADVERARGDLSEIGLGIIAINRLARDAGQS